MRIVDIEDKWQGWGGGGIFADAVDVQRGSSVRHVLLKRQGKGLVQIRQGRRLAGHKVAKHGRGCVTVAIGADGGVGASSSEGAVEGGKEGVELGASRVVEKGQNGRVRLPHAVAQDGEGGILADGRPQGRGLGVGGVQEQEEEEGMEEEEGAGIDGAERGRGRAGEA